MRRSNSPLHTADKTDEKHLFNTKLRPNRQSKRSLLQSLSCTKVEYIIRRADGS